MLKSNMHSFPYCHERSRVHGVFPVILLFWLFLVCQSHESCFQACEYVLKRAKWQLVDRERPGNARQSFNPDDQFDFSLSLHTSKRSIERYSRKFTWNKVLKAYQLQHSSNNLLKETCLYQKWCFHGKTRSQGSLSCFEKERWLRLVTRKCVSINCAAEVGLLIGPSLNLADWRKMRYYLG